MKKTLYLRPRLLKHLLFLLVFLTSYSLYSQYELWGLTPNGGTSGKGVVFKYSNNTTQAIHNYESPHAGQLPWSVKLVRASNGLLYGMTNWGGMFNGGLIFEYNPANQNYRVLYNFNYVSQTSGYWPRGSMIQASNGKLYGTAYGGSAGGGIIFEYDLSASTYAVVHNFANATGYGANECSLVEGDNAKLYGITALGGAMNGGVLFEFDIASKIYAKKFDFSASTGYNPRGGIMRASNGKFYGMTSQGGYDSKGSIYEYDAVNNTLIVKKHFGENPDGSYVSGAKPEGLLTEHPNGKFYGLTPRGGYWGVGVLFEYDMTTNTITRRAEFGPNNYIPAGNESTPFSSLMVATNGNLYGVTTAEDIYSTIGGFIFEFNPSTNSIVAKKSIASSRSTLIELPDGMLYGVTVYGGGTFGDLFRFDPGSNTLTSLFSFDDAPQGARPYGALTQAFNGKFYGMAYEGGSAVGAGVIFQIDPSSGEYARLNTFSPFTGPARPKAGFTLHPNGKLYGITAYGGTIRHFGSVIEFDPAYGVITHTVHLDQTPGALPTNGQEPLGELTLARNGKYYFLASRGGKNSVGTLLEYDPLLHTINKKFDFGGTSGSLPKGSLTLALDGKLYGTTFEGGSSNFGVLFAFDPSTGTVTKKADFTSNSTGFNPEGKMVAASDGALYGLTRYGGIGIGIIYKYNIATGQLFSVHNFQVDEGSAPTGGHMIELPNGKLYGMTKAGGVNRLGVVFEFDPVTGIVIPIHSFDGTTGAFPEYTSLTFQKQSQVINAATVPLVKNFGDPSFTLEASASSGLPVFYVSSDPTIASIENNQVGIKAAGTVTIFIVQAGNTSYLPAPMMQVELTINKATLVAKPKNAKRTYGIVNPSFEIEYAGFIGADTETVLDSPPVSSTTAQQFSNVGDYTITLGGGEDNNYTFTISEGTLTVEKASLKVRANNQTRKYGQDNSALTVTYEGFAGTDDIPVLNALPVVSTPATTASNVGDYQITLAGGFDDNYAFTLENGILTITKAELNVIADNKTKTYGQQNPQLTFSYSGFLGSNDETVLDQIPTISTTVVTNSNAGSYPITISGGSDNNYSFTLKGGTLTVGKTDLKATAENKTKVFGEANPELTIRYEGFLAGDNQSMLDAAPVASTSVSKATNVGSYPIVMTGGVDNNYLLNLANGTFVVTKAPQTITFSLPPEKILSEGSFALSASASSGLPVVFTSSDPSISQITGNSVNLLKAGEVNITASQPGNENYMIAPEVTRPLIIIPVTGVEPHIANTELLYPNPTSGKLFFHDSLIGETVVFMNVTGKIVLQKEVSTDEPEIDIADLPAGAYLVISFSSTQPFRMRVIKL